MDLKLKDKVALVTAGSKGIGRAAAEELIKEGCKVAICSSNKDNLMKAATEIKNEYNVEPLWSVCDINDKNEIERTVATVVKEYGNIDILVNNCGGPAPGYFDDLDDSDWEYAFNQVLMSVVRFTRLVLPLMRKNKWGRIINVTSLSVKQPVDNLMLSNALRSAVTSFAKTLSQQVGKDGITVNNVAPGFILTSRLYDLAVTKAKEQGTSHEKILADMGHSNPVGYVGNPEDMGAAIAFLASARADYITGVTLQVDGGQIKATY